MPRKALPSRKNPPIPKLPQNKESNTVLFPLFLCHFRKQRIKERKLSP